MNTDPDEYGVSRCFVFVYSPSIIMLLYVLNVYRFKGVSRCFVFVYSPSIIMLLYVLNVYKFK